MIKKNLRYSLVLPVKDRSVKCLAIVVALSELSRAFIVISDLQRSHCMEYGQHGATDVV